MKHPGLPTMSVSDLEARLAHLTTRIPKDQAELAAIRRELKRRKKS